MAIGSYDKAFVVNGKASWQPAAVGMSCTLVTQYRVKDSINIRLHAFSLFSQIISL